MPPFRIFVTSVLFAFVSLLPVGAAKAQSVSQELHAEVAAADSIMFGAFNARDLATLKAMFTKDLEFYHDQSGFTSYEENMAAFEDLFARNDGLRRDLVPGSLEVYPVKNYGAMAIGRHTFCHMEGGEEDCGTFPFAMVWRKDGEAWKVSRVLSYGH